MTRRKTLFKKIYDAESMVDLERDMLEVFDSVTTNKEGNPKGYFTVKIKWEDEDED